MATWFGIGAESIPVLPQQLSVRFLQIPGAIWDFGVCCSSGIPGEEEEAATQGQHICPGLAPEPGPRLGSLGHCPKGFRPHPRASAEAAGKFAAGKTEPAGSQGGRHGGVQVPSLLTVPTNAPDVCMRVGCVLLGRNLLKSRKGWVWDAWWSPQGAECITCSHRTILKSWAICWVASQPLAPGLPGSPRSPES